MDKKKILIVSSAFYPEISPRSFRATELAKEFARQGHEVKVITHKFPEQEPLSEEYGFVIKDLGKRKWKAVSVKGKGVERFLRRAAFRFSGLLFEYPNIELYGMVKRSLADEEEYDLMISIAVPYPVHWGVAASRNKNHRIADTWVADCGDPYMGQENDSFKVPFYFSVPEKNFCKKADYISVPTQNSIDGYYPEFRKKIKVIPQGFRFEDITLYTGPRTEIKPFFGYAGMFIPGRRDPTEFLTYLNSLVQDFRFDIYTSTPQFVSALAEQSRGRVTIKPVISRDSLLFELSKMDFVVNFENVGKKQTPSKLIDYAIINKPVLSIKPESLDEEIIHQFLKSDYRNRMQIQDIEQYRIENICKLFLGLSN